MKGWGTYGFYDPTIKSKGQEVYVFLFLHVGKRSILFQERKKGLSIVCTTSDYRSQPINCLFVCFSKKIYFFVRTPRSLILVKLSRYFYTESL